MTKEEFIESHRHEWGGWVADALVMQRGGTALAAWQRECFRKIDRELGKIYDQLKLEFQPVPNNGQERKGANEQNQKRPGQ